MHSKSALLLLLLSGVAGYLLEPWLTRGQENDVTASASSSTTREPAEKPALPGFVYVNPDKEKVPPPIPAEREAPTVTKVPEKVVKPNEPPQPPKVDFPVTSLELDRPDKDSSTWCPNLDKAIHFAVKNIRFEDLLTLLETELYKPVRKNDEISAKQLNELIDNPAWNHAVNVYTLLREHSPKKIGH